MKLPIPNVTTERCVTQQGEPGVGIKIQEGDNFEINITIKEEEIPLLARVKNAKWDDRGSLRIGVCAGSAVFWCSENTRLSILVGHDDETWDIAVDLPLSTLAEIEKEIQNLHDK
jgi:hypothetical protein